MPRKGQWVVDAGGRVGVLVNVGRFQVNRNPDNDLVDPSRGEFHAVDGRGETTGRHFLPLAELRVARVGEIPKSRVGHLKKAELKRLGYEE